MVGPNQLRDAYRKVMDSIGEAAIKSGRKPGDVLMVAVTKNASPDQIRTLVELGHKDLGENRVQHLQQRVATLDEFLARRRTLGGTGGRGAAELPQKVRWHMIGHLQRNKVKQVVPLVQVIHSIESLRLAEELHAFAARTDRTVDVLIQVNTSGETSKFGVAAPAVIHLAEQIDSMVHLRLRGLMTMAPHSENPEDSRPVFARTAELFQDIRSAKYGGNDCNLLSMGMTNDFEIAIQEGANVVRIGRALFGEAEQPELPEG
jgi:pyridoxal phosphate enzyme (YggS family)